MYVVVKDRFSLVHGTPSRGGEGGGAKKQKDIHGKSLFFDRFFPRYV